MRATARALALEVSRVFANRECPEADSIAETPADEGTAAYFAGKSWQDLNAADLMQRRSALTFFTPAAFVYFLPAFLRAALETGNIDLIDAAVSAVTPPKNDPKRPSYRRWWTLLTAPQQGAVMKCLRHWESVEGNRA